MRLLKVFALAFFVLISTTVIHAQGDECVDAVNLPNLTKYCSASKQFTNVGSSIGIYPTPSCWSTDNTYDVWFKFTAIGTDVQMSVTGGGTDGTIKRPNIMLYSGSCSATLSDLACSNSGTTDVVNLYKSAIVPGTTYLIRIATTSSNRGSFKFCIMNYTPTVNPTADCDGAASLCDKSPVLVGGLSGGGKNNNEIEANSCFNSPGNPSALESNSSWFKWTCEKAGTLTFNIIPNNLTDDLDFILYELAGTTTNACGTRTIMRCQCSSCPSATGVVGLHDTCTDISEPINCTTPNSDGFVKYVNMIAGKTYVLMVNNFSTVSGFRINFGGTGTFLGPKAVIGGSSATGCPGSNLTFSGNLSMNYTKLQWTFPSGSPNSVIGAGPHTIKYNNPGTYTAYLTASDAICSAIDSSKITIFAIPPTPQVIANIPHCETDVIGPITANGTGGTFTWFSDPLLKNTLHTGPVYTPVTTVTDTIYLTETVNGCTSKPGMVIITVSKKGILPLKEGFEEASFPPKDWMSNNVQNDAVFWEHDTVVGGFGTSTKSLVFDNYNYDVKGNRDQLFTPVLDLSTITGPVFSFNVSYARKDSASSDSLAVLVSKDCGVTFTEVYLKGGKELATVATDLVQPKFVPTATQWRTEFVDISAFAKHKSAATGKDIIIAFQNRGHHGQPIYIDNIGISQTITSIHDESEQPELLIAPNPTSSVFDVFIKTNEMIDVTIEVRNVLGQSVKKELIKNSIGSIHRTFDISNQSAGIYSVIITYGATSITRKLVKK
jgi:hypothetical protein